MPFIPPEQLARAREMDLLTYLRCCEPEELVSVGGNTYATKSHDSLKISNGEWYWWSRGVGGSSALDYLTTVRRLSLPDAVQRVLSAGGVALTEPPRRKRTPDKIICPAAQTRRQPACFFILAWARHRPGDHQPLHQTRPAL